MIPSTEDNDQVKNHIDPEILIKLHKLGFKIVPLREDHVPNGKWGPVYDDPNYWTVERLKDPKEYTKFKNVASTVGITHLKDEESEEHGEILYLNVLDVDSEPIFDILDTPIGDLHCIIDKNYPYLYGFLNTRGGDPDRDPLFYTPLIEYLEQITFVTKTKKPYGYHIWWLSHRQNEPIMTSDCMKGCEFEIKTDKKNGLGTLPPSPHRDDPEFVYYPTGRTDGILISDDLYGAFRELFDDWLIADESKKRVEDNDCKSSNVNSINQKPKDIVFHNLSPKAIQTSIDYLSPYYSKGDRHNFALAFSGMAFHFRISKDSATFIVEGLCDKANDYEEKKSRINTLASTYKNGIDGRSVTGAPSFADLIVRIKEYDKSFANNLINTLKELWKDDIHSRKEIDSDDADDDDSNTTKELSIAHAKREKSGHVKVKGTIIGISSVYNMIKAVTLNCEVCGYSTYKQYEKPVFKSPHRERYECNACSKEASSSSNDSLIATPEYISVVDLELQDLETFSEIERLSVKVFENNTYDVTAGEVVNIKGHLHVIRKNDNNNNKLETVLFAKSLEYVKKQELVLTEKDIQKNKEWVKNIQDQGKNPIDELVNLFAPELIDLDPVKKGMLMVCANAGLGNVDNSLPKRLRINAFMIGNPGLAKTTVLEKTVKLVPNSQYAGGQSSTGLSLTSQISKEDGGMYTLRFGPIVLAKDSVCAINELGQLPIQDHKHLLDCMEENGFPMAKYGFSSFIEAHPSIIVSANPVNNKWENEDVVNFGELPTLPQIIDRSDLIFIFRENNDPSYLRKYAEKKKEIAENYKNGIYEGNEEFIKKCLLNIRNIKVKVLDETYSLLTDFFINMGKAGVSGLPRKLDSLIRITVAIAKLKLKDVAEVEDAEEAILFYNEQLKYFNQTAELVKNPRDVTYQEIKQTLKENKGIPILLTDAAEIACERNESVKYYLLGRKGLGKVINSNNRDINNKDNDDNKERLKLRNNWHLNEVLNLLRNDPFIQIIKDKPIAVRWIQERSKSKPDIKKKFDNSNSNSKSIHDGPEDKDEDRVNCHEYNHDDDNKKEKKSNQQKTLEESCNTITNICDGCDVCNYSKKEKEKEEKISTNSTTTIYENPTNSEIGRRCSNSGNVEDNDGKYNVISKEIKEYRNDKENTSCINLEKFNLSSGYPQTSHTKHRSPDRSDIAERSSNNRCDNCEEVQKETNSIKGAKTSNQEQIQKRQSPPIKLKYSPYADITNNNDEDLKIGENLLEEPESEADDSTSASTPSSASTSLY